MSQGSIDLVVTTRYWMYISKSECSTNLNMNESYPNRQSYLSCLKGLAMSLVVLIPI